jgi:hypothetical protein
MSLSSTGTTTVCSASRVTLQVARTLSFEHATVVAVDGVGVVVAGTVKAVGRGSVGRGGVGDGAEVGAAMDVDGLVAGEVTDAAGPAAPTAPHATRLVSSGTVSSVRIVDAPSRWRGDTRTPTAGVIPCQRPYTP